jgi:3-methylcrotonyl-CoA carboxylase beta subunit
VPDEDLTTRMDEVREEYERQLDARFAAARGFVDESCSPESSGTRSRSCSTLR